jgi:cytosine/adenosine deaminase-related metal-dependent hydrolase
MYDSCLSGRDYDAVTGLRLEFLSLFLLQGCAMHDLLIKNASLPDGQRGIDILIRNGNISAIGPAIYADGIPQIDAAGDLVCSPFVDAHFHMDAVLSYGLPE